ncbi:MAG: hypothetical protein ABIG63_04585 [Chloroflexota bacterium]
MSDAIDEAGRNPDGTPNEALKKVWAERYPAIDEEPIKPTTEDMRQAMYDKPECWEK